MGDRQLHADLLINGAVVRRTRSGMRMGPDEIGNVGRSLRCPRVKVCSSCRFNDFRESARNGTEAGGRNTAPRDPLPWRSILGRDKRSRFLVNFFAAARTNVKLLLSAI
jgi:hypothetical protein